ncbi:MAG: glycosyltransferase, partial [Flavobacteriales bacterium]|nr:glycosyltransferase [Flavobacteriales bacterium]
MKILYYSGHPQLNFNASTGYGTHMREMVKGFEALGHEVDICIIGGTEPEASNEKIIEPSLLKKTAKKLIPSIIWSTLKDKSLLKFDRFAQTELEKKVTTFNPDIIYERGFYLMTSGCNVAAKHGIKHVLEINAPFEYEKELFEGKTLLVSKGKKLESTL